MRCAACNHSFDTYFDPLHHRMEDELCQHCLREAREEFNLWDITIGDGLEEEDE